MQKNIVKLKDILGKYVVVKIETYLFAGIIDDSQGPELQSLNEMDTAILDHSIMLSTLKTPNIYGKMMVKLADVIEVYDTYEQLVAQHFAEIL